MNTYKLLLWPFAIFYGLLLRLRHWAYDRQYFSSTTFKTPTICVGNLSLGGTGKTPMIIMLLHYYNSQNISNLNSAIAVLSRGYGRKSKGVLEASATISVDFLGDEPFQISRSFPSNRVVVSASRVAGMNFLEDPSCGLPPNLVLLDDAFQHRAISPSFSILLTSFSKPFPADALLPMGTLRDLPSRAKNAQMIVVTKCPRSLTDEQRNAIIKKMEPFNSKQIFFSYLQYEAQWPGVSSTVSAATFKGKQITLITAIANPMPLLLHLEALGLEVVHKPFADHHFFTKNEINALSKLSNLLCTEKDFVKLSIVLDGLHYIPVSHAFFKEDKELFYKALPAI